MTTEVKYHVIKSYQGYMLLMQLITVDVNLALLAEAVCVRLLHSTFSSQLPILYSLEGSLMHSQPLRSRESYCISLRAELST